MATRPLPRSVFCQQAVFEEGEETGIVPSLRAYVEDESSEFSLVSKPGGKL